MQRLFYKYQCKCLVCFFNSQFKTIIITFCVHKSTQQANKKKNQKTKKVAALNFFMFILQINYINLSFLGKMTKILKEGQFVALYVCKDTGLLWNSKCSLFWSVDVK